MLHGPASRPVLLFPRCRRKAARLDTASCCSTEGFAYSKLMIGPVMEYNPATTRNLRGMVICMWDPTRIHTVITTSRHPSIPLHVADLGQSRFKAVFLNNYLLDPTLSQQSCTSLVSDNEFQFCLLPHQQLGKVSLMCAHRSSLHTLCNLT